MKPSEQLSEGQRKRVRQLAQEHADNMLKPRLPYGISDSCERAILQAFDELVPEMVQDSEQKLVKARKDIERLLNADSCNRCPDQGYIAHQVSEEEWDQEQCEFCYTNENSVFNVRAAIAQER